MKDIFSQLITKRRDLAKMISRVESDSEQDQDVAEDLVVAAFKKCQHTSLSIGRVIAVTGAPGAGKSTLINAYGMFLADQGFKVAVLAVDPSSLISSGAIMGDKTRMLDLARHPNAFIRPIPSGAGHLGGMSSKTEDIIIILKAAGYDYIFLETIGVGQNEVDGCLVADHVIMVVPPASGDDIQAVKRGNLEFSDLIIVNKFDGETQVLAQSTASDYQSSLGHAKKVVLVSSQNRIGFDVVHAILGNLPRSIADQRQLLKHRVEKMVLSEIMKIPEVSQMYDLVLQKEGPTRSKATLFINNLKKLLTKEPQI